MNTVAEKLPESMSAVVCHAPKDYRLEERSVPKPGPEEVLIKVKSTGICASDIKALNYKVPASLPWHYAAFVEPLACSIHAGAGKGNRTLIAVFP